MTVKYMKKSKLQMIDGMICNKKGEVLGINPKIAELFNQLETEIQEKMYMDKQPEAQPMPSLDGFEREHANGNVKIPTIEVAETPIIDKRIKEAMAFVKEVEAQHTADEANKKYEDYALLFQFVENESILVNTDMLAEYGIDTPFIGDVLKLDKEDLADLIGFVAGVCELVVKED